MFGAGVDVITSGNHVYRHRNAYEFLDRAERVIRPANYPSGNPGRGHTVAEAGGRRVGVINLSGALYLTVARDPFPAADEPVERLQRETDALVVDFHCELDEREGRDGVASRRPASRRGARHAHPCTHGRRARAPRRHGLHLGRRDDRLAGGDHRRQGHQALEAFRTQMPIETADEDVWVNAVAVERRRRIRRVDRTGADARARLTPNRRGAPVRLQARSSLRDGGPGVFGSLALEGERKGRRPI